MGRSETHEQYTNIIPPAPAYGPAMDDDGTRMAALLAEVRACRICEEHLPLGPRPIVAASPSARLLIVGQAPGTAVHRTGVPWNDPSGERLRDWMGVAPGTFYDETHVAIVPMGYCYPGRGRSGDLPPRKECAEHWLDRILELLPRRALTLLIGQYAQSHFLGADRKRTLTDTVRAWRDYAPDRLPLPHPSPRNNLWLRRNPWFEAEVVPELRTRCAQLLHKH